jgi:DNA-binding beta-propeller fold protein YncE
VGNDLGQLDVVDCTADTVLAEVELGIDYARRMALSSSSRKLYCAGVPDTAVVIVSTDSLTTIGVVRGLEGLDSMIYCPATNSVFCPEYYSGASVLDCQADTVRAWIEMQSLVSMAVSTLNGRAYLAGDDSARVMVVDTTDAIVGSIQLPAVPTHGVPALTFSPGRNELYGVTSGDLAFTINASTDTLTGTLSYAAYLPRQMVHNPAGNKLYLLCTGNDVILVLDSTFGAPKHILGGATDSDALPVLNPTLNRIYVADGGQLRVIDCNSDSLLESKRMYGISAPVPVMVPYLNKLYVFEGSGGADSVYAYDCLRNTAASLLFLPDAVPSAVFDPRTNRIYFACEDAPTIRALNPVTGVIERTFDLVGGSRDGRLALNLDLGRLYYTDQSPNMMFTIDLLADSVMVSESLPWDIDTMFLDRRLGKLYLCSRDTASVLVFDCSKGTIVDTIAADYHYAGLLDEINDKLYLRYGAVVDCRYDSVVTTLPESLNPRCMAWDAIDNRVFQATTSRLYVYRDGPYGIEEQPSVPLKRRHATIVRGALFLPQASGVRRGASSVLLDISGRKVLDLQPGANDVRKLPAGVYFVRQAVSSKITKVVIQR